MYAPDSSLVSFLFPDELHDQWNSGWPIQVTTQFATSVFQSLGNGPNVNIAANHNALTQFVGSTATDDEHIRGLRAMPNGGEKIYMGAVSPWFFTHYSPQTFNKNVSTHFLPRCVLID